MNATSLEICCTKQMVLVQNYTSKYAFTDLITSNKFIRADTLPRIYVKILCPTLVLFFFFERMRKSFYLKFRLRLRVYFLGEKWKKNVSHCVKNFKCTESGIFVLESNVSRFAAVAAAAAAAVAAGATSSHQTRTLIQISERLIHHVFYECDIHSRKSRIQYASYSVHTGKMSIVCPADGFERQRQRRRPILASTPSSTYTRFEINTQSTLRCTDVR